MRLIELPQRLWAAGIDIMLDVVFGDWESIWDDAREVLVRSPGRDSNPRPSGS